jgi:hypothetical protein
VSGHIGANPPGVLAATLGERAFSVAFTCLGLFGLGVAE